jgi:tRNA threonylcarbamoyl adenosine modification protein YeaZ
LKTLYLNTISAQTTIALFDGNTALAEKRWKAEMNEAEKLQPEVNELLTSQQLSPDDIQQLVICVGPGGFTSSRIGVSAVNAWAFAKGVPVAQVSLFDLYQVADISLLISANSNEAWVKMPDGQPQFLTREQVNISEPFSFGGVMHDDWKQHLEEQGGTYLELEESLPKLEHLEFRKEMVQPWYYKDANITWSEKNAGIKK